MLIQEIHVLVAQLLAKHLFDALSQQTAVQSDKALLRQLTDQRSDVLVFHVGVGVELTALRRVARLHVVHHEVQTTLRVAILVVLMTIQHVCLCHLIVALGHQRNLHLILNLFYGCFVTYSQVRQDTTERLLGSKCTYS